MLVAAATVGTVIASSTPAEAATVKFASCAQLNRVFPHGVAKSPAAAATQVAQGYGRPATSRYAKNVYAVNHSRLDRDGDGTACER